MDFKEAVKKNLPLMVRLPDGNDRIVSDFFEVDGGYVFIEADWDTAGGHPVHRLDGSVRGDGPWNVRLILIEILVDGTPEKAQWDDWEKRRKAEGARLSTATALRIAQSVSPSAKII